MRWMQDKPIVVTVALTILVVAHAVVAGHWAPTDIWAPLVALEASVSATLYVGLAGLAVAAAGFAGVIVIFGLEAQSERFLIFRIVGARPLRASWLSVVATSFGAAALALTAAVIAFLNHPGVSPWLFELAILLLAHATFRLLWLLTKLTHVVQQEDSAKLRTQRKIPLDMVFPESKAG
ncbi:MAG: hypothetical protein NVV70_06330 [Cellulomonas sp.]|nr:hypothetical protein [Cellulomonas sp.]MCR6647761.1 hypothetical protein [Cellulomonas sp.]